ncbi:hypothetical protein CFP56_037668 [Quercus suber]|uniref:Uncharacterized protein n=1 Tax=Quercus suber TaxID=58331 RepID=A0AAW0J4B1_QUESU
MLKTNFDGIVFEDLNATSVDVVVRNSLGEIMTTLFKIIPIPSSMVALETIVVRTVV